LSDWGQSLCRLAWKCTEDVLSDDQTLIDAAHRLLSEAPSAFAGLIGELPDRQVIASLVALDAYESAAMRLLPRQFGLMLSRGPGREGWLASSCLSGREEDVTCRASSAAAAMLGAYLSELAGFSDGLGNRAGQSLTN
jgi:hypothetical protein